MLIEAEFDLFDQSPFNSPVIFCFDPGSDYEVDTAVSEFIDCN